MRLRAGGVAAVLALLGVAGCGSSSPAAGGSPNGSPNSSATSAPAATTPATSASTGPGGNPSGGGPASSAAVAAITKAYTMFFNGQTPAATKIALLQNGQQFAPVIQAQASSPLAKSTTATVAKVTSTGPTTADVTYTVLLGGQPALPGASGKAVLEGVTWKVASASFCQLLALQGQRVPACPAA